MNDKFMGAMLTPMIAGETLQKYLELQKDIRKNLQKENPRAKGSNNVYTESEEDYSKRIDGLLTSAIRNSFMMAVADKGLSVSF